MFCDEKDVLYYYHQGHIGPFIVQLQHDDYELEDLKKSSPRHVRLVGNFTDMFDIPVLECESKNMDFQLSVRAEVEKAVNDYLFYIGLDGWRIDIESRSVVMRYGEVQYSVSFGGTPGEGGVSYSVDFNQQYLDGGFKDIDIKQRNDLMKFADDICRGHLVNVLHANI